MRSGATILWRLIMRCSHDYGFLEVFQIVLGCYNAKANEVLVI